MIVQIIFETATEPLLCFKAYYTWWLCFFANIKLDWLCTTASNKSREFSESIHNSKELFVCFRPVLTIKLSQSQSLILRPIAHVICISANYQTGAVADYSLETIKWL